VSLWLLNLLLVTTRFVCHLDFPSYYFSFHDSAISGNMRLNDEDNDDYNEDNVQLTGNGIEVKENGGLYSNSKRLVNGASLVPPAASENYAHEIGVEKLASNNFLKQVRLVRLPEADEKMLTEDQDTLNASQDSTQTMIESSQKNVHFDVKPTPPQSPNRTSHVSIENETNRRVSVELSNTPDSHPAVDSSLPSR
jgi:hypothetical protein